MKMNKQTSEQTNERRKEGRKEVVFAPSIDGLQPIPRDSVVKGAAAMLDDQAKEANEKSYLPSNMAAMTSVAKQKFPILLLS